MAPLPGRAAPPMMVPLPSVRRSLASYLLRSPSASLLRSGFYLHERSQRRRLAYRAGHAWRGDRMAARASARFRDRARDGGGLGCGRPRSAFAGFRRLRHLRVGDGAGGVGTHFGDGRLWPAVSSRVDAPARFPAHSSRAGRRAARRRGGSHALGARVRPCCHRRAGGAGLPGPRVHETESRSPIAFAAILGNTVLGPI